MLAMSKLKLALTLLLAPTALGLVHSTRSDDDPGRYTICGGDRGYTERDSLEAAQKLENKIVTSDRFFMEREDCIFAHVNTTIVSLCNGNGRPRHINRAEVRRGVNQLIKDCGLEGGFTGIHVVNNLTFAAYGVFGGINMKPPKGSNPPDVPGTGSRQRLKDDCNLVFNGEERTDCNFKNTFNEDGSCGAWQSLENGCEQFCEQTRMGLLGVETSAPGKAGESNAVTLGIGVDEGTEVSISNGFSIGVEGVFKEVVGAGLSYSWSLTTTKSFSTSLSAKDDETEHLSTEEKAELRSRWVYFPKLIKSCGTVSKTDTVPGSIPACGTSVCPPANEKCGSKEERTENVCVLSPLLDSNGENVLFWALRLEYENGKPVPMDKQSPSYRNACNKQVDPDGDDENECMNDNPARRHAVDFVAMKRDYERKLAQTARKF
ncbi:hypothetical protein OPT61_g8274 [Boeremia exigua]|uniref:Uncharacterized protein n=1 Tax=Boeremia exigua TaxID=749465 RepID=A0ACC2HYU6_9PLEO|nr:hypothetical protein OPT61_g8274 [Boeremia exigua]